MPKKWDYLSAQNYINDRDHKLITPFFDINVSSKINVKCNKCEYQIEIVFKSYLDRGISCFCSDKIRWTYDMVKFAISKQGDSILSDTFDGYNSKLLLKCNKCGESYQQTLNLYRKGYKHKKCSDKLFESNSGRKLATRPVTYLNKICVECKNEFTICKSLQTRITCSDECLIKYKKSDLYIAKLRKAGLSSVKASCNRSKNEIYFSELCKKQFQFVLTNEKMFEGWDADVILPNLKIAISWNGIFHYKAIRKGMNIDKVTNRDRLKSEAIIRAGYIPYVIKDMGSHNKKFVEFEFKRLLDYIYFV